MSERWSGGWADPLLSGVSHDLYVCLILKMTCALLSSVRLPSRSTGNLCYRRRPAGCVRMCKRTLACPLPLPCCTDPVWCGLLPSWQAASADWETLTTQLGCAVFCWPLRRTAGHICVSFRSPCSQGCPSSASWSVSSWPNIDLSQPSLQTLALHSTTRFM